MLGYKCTLHGEVTKMASIDSALSAELLPMPSPEIVAQLRRNISTIHRSYRPRQGQKFPIDIPEVMDLFPGGQLPYGSIMEWFTETHGTEAESLSLRIGWSACLRNRFLVIVDPCFEIYPPGLSQLGIDLNRVVFVHPATKSDMLWTIDQALRCSAVGAVWSYLESLDPINHRRYQLASECGGTVGIFVRPLRARKESSWAEFRLLVQPVAFPAGEIGSQCRRIQVTLLRAPGLSEPIVREVWIDDPADRLLDIQRVEPFQLRYQYQKNRA